MKIPGYTRNIIYGILENVVMNTKVSRGLQETPESNYREHQRMPETTRASQGTPMKAKRELHMKSKDYHGGN